MGTQYKTPGVYISEPNSFPPSIVGVETAVPAFIGYTEKARYGARDLHLLPTRIGALADYVARFGNGFRPACYLLPETELVPAGDRRIGAAAFYEGGPVYSLVRSGTRDFNLYESLQLFFNNGGGDCYIVSCGQYDEIPPAAVAKGRLIDGLAVIGSIVGPTILVMPDAVLLDDPADYDELAVAMLEQCMRLQDRVAILDVWGTYDIAAPVPPPGPNGANVTMESRIERFRAGLAGAPPESLRYGMAYVPNLATSLVSAADIGIGDFDTAGDRLDTLVAALTDCAAHDEAPAIAGLIGKLGTSVPDAQAEPGTPLRGGAMSHSELTKALLAGLPPLARLFQQVADSRNVLPPSGAMAGIFARTDADPGVWNAPANVGVATVIAPTVAISDDQQQDMNTPSDGKAVNAIRTFPGRGPLVWGARTLDGNSNDWRYIHVSRTMIYIEQSVKTALGNFVFAPNTAQTWVTVVATIESFLHGLWSAGGLMGNSPKDAFFVGCGLGSTMTADDILNEVMVVAITVQIANPLEFINIVFQQQMLGGPHA